MNAIKFLKNILSVAFILTASVWGGAASGDSGRTAQAPDFWGQVIINKETQLRSLSRGVDVLTKNVDRKIDELNTFTAYSSTKFHELHFLLLVNRRSPYDLEMIYGEIGKLNDKFSSKIVEVEKMAHYLRSLEATLLEMDKTLEQLSKEARAEEEKNAVKSIKFTMDDLRGRILPSASKLSNSLSKAVELKKNIDENMKRINADIPAHLKKLMLKPEFNIFSRDIWLYLPFAWEQWSMELTNILFQKLPDSSDKYISFLLILALAGFPLFLSGIVFFRKKFPGVKNKYPVAHFLIMRAWTIFMLSITLLSSGIVLNFPETIVFYRLGVILATWAAIDFAWGLKRIFIQKEHPTPLIPLFWLYVIGIIYQVLNIPYSMLSVVWPFTIVVITIFMNRKKKDALPFFERYIVHVSFWAGMLMLLMSFAGYVYLSMFISLTWFMVCLGVQFGSSISFIIRHFYGKASHDKKELRRILIVGLGIPFIWFSIIAFIIAWIITQFGEITLFESLLGAKFKWNNFSISLLDASIIIFLFFVFKSLSNVIDTSLMHLSGKKKHERKSFIPLMKILTFYLIWSCYALMVFLVLKINFTSIAVILGGMSVGIGFGMQNIVNNIMSGLIIVFGKSLHEGDIIQLNEIWATVLKINMRTTLVETFDHAIIEIPNSDILTNRFTNWTLNDNNIRRDITVGVAYGSDIAKVEKTLIGIADGHSNILKEPAPSVLLMNFADSSIEFALRVWISDINQAATTQSDIRKTIYRVFAENNIEISFPQLDVHLKDAKTIPVDLTQKVNS